MHADIIQAGNPILRQRNEEVKRELIQTNEIQTIISKMFSIMKEVNGVGLAAPQIGINLRIFTYGFEHNPRYPHASPIPDTVMINPQILKYSNDFTHEYEGCLSLQTLRCKVPRYKEIFVKAYDQFGNEIERTICDFEAKIIQHEIDHLDGKLFLERVSDYSSLGFMDELKKAGLF